MNPSRRSKLREDLRADAARFAALAERHGTPLLVLQPHLVARRYRELADGAAGIPAALRGQGVAASGRAVDDRDLRRRVRRRHQCRGRPSAAARPADGPLHPHAIRSRSPWTSTWPTRRASAHSSSRTPARHRNSRAGRPTSSCWCGWRSAIRPRSPTCRRNSASSRPTPSCSSSTSSPRVCSSPGSASTSAARARRLSPTARRCATRWT